MNTFKSCLAFGKSYEKESLQYLDYDTHEFSEGCVKEWDIKTVKDNVTTYYEVKSELNCYKYGNICIEFRCNNKESGITSTTADYWLHYAILDKIKNRYTLFKVPVNKLREMIDNKLYHRIVNCGDNNLCYCYIFKMELFYPYKFAMV